MESEEGIRLRKQALRPIETKSNRSTSGEDHDMKEEAEEEPLSPAGRLFHEPNFNVHILAVMGCKIRIDPVVALAKAKANLPHTLLKHPRFSSIPVVDEKGGGKMKWVRTEVDLDKHIIIPDIDLANYKDCPEIFLEDYIYNLAKTSLDMSRPLWDLHILDVKTSLAEGVGVFRFHHSLGDGISLTSLLLACTRQTSNPEALPTIPTGKCKEYDHNNGDFIINRMFLLGLYRMRRVFTSLWNTVVDVFMFIATAFLLIKDSKTPVKGPPGSENNPRRVVFKIVSLDDLKLVKNAMNMTINDVALGATQAGLSIYLNRRYGLENNKDEGGTEKKNNLPKNIRLRSILFINIRPSPGLQALADMMEKNTKAKWGNGFGYVLLPFTIGLRDDPLDYVREAKATSDRKKHSFGALCSFFIAGFVFKFFGIKSASSFFQRLFTGTTLAFSNVVGPLEEIGFYGYPMAFLAGSTYGQASELLVSLQSYKDKMTVSLAVDENTIPDPHQLLDDIVESLKLIKDAAIKKELVK